MPSGQRNSCAACGNTAGVFTCRGCTRNFCLRHTNEHREEIEKQMNEIFAIHQQLRQAITGQTTEQFRHTMVHQIDQWEQQSIDKIHQVAKEVRQQLVSTVRERADNLKDKMVQLTQQLNKARRDGEFFENDVKEWTERINTFQRLFIEQQKIHIEQERNSAPFISRISLNDSSDYSLADSIDDIKYVKRSDIVQKYIPLPNLDNTVYSSGHHVFRFKIEQYEPNSSVFFGIISSKNNLENVDPYENPTFYGWADKNIVYLGGKCERNYDGYKTDIQDGDVFKLTMDCDRERISLKNERTHRTYHIDVEIGKCPFPWQTNVRFFLDPDGY